MLEAATLCVQVLFDLKMHGQSRSATPRRPAEAASSHQQLKDMLALDSLPSLSLSESRRVRDLFMRAVTEADKASTTPSAKSSQLAHRQYETQQASPATARMGLQAYSIWAALAYGAGSAATDGKSKEWVRERSYAIHCHRAAEPHGALSLQGMLLLLRPALRGSLGQAAASAYSFYDLDNSGLISKVCRKYKVATHCGNGCTSCSSCSCSCACMCMSVHANGCGYGTYGILLPVRA